MLLMGGKLLRFLFVIAGLTYFVWPFDAISDVIPWLGRVDDLLVIAYLVYLYREKKLSWAELLEKAHGRLSRTAHGQRYAQDPSPRNPDPNHADNGRSAYHRDNSGRDDNPLRSKPTPKRSPFEVLGLEEGASPEEIRAAYKRLVAQYHPDKVNHLGDELKKLANTKILEIQDAYNTLVSKR